MSRPDLPDQSRLWRHMQDTHGISLLVSEEADIVNAVNEDHHHALEAALAERDEARADADEWQNKYAAVFVERDEAQQSLRQARDRCWKLGRERNHWKRESLLQARLLAMSDVREERLRESLQSLLNPSCAVEEATATTTQPAKL